MKPLFDLHTHTMASVHAYSTLRENAIEAKRKGLEILGVSDHGYAMPETTWPSYWMNLKVFPDYLEGVRILRGMEANIADYDGALGESEHYLERMDYVIASLHHNVIEAGSVEENTRAIIGAMDNPYVKIIGHPDDSRYPVDYEKIVKKAVETEVALEVNNSSLNPTSFRQGAQENIRTYLKLCKEHGVQVVLNSDAHIYTDVGNFDLALAVLEELDFPEELVLNRSWSALEKLLGMSL